MAPKKQPVTGSARTTRSQQSMQQRNREATSGQRSPSRHPSRDPPPSPRQVTDLIAGYQGAPPPLQARSGGSQHPSLGQHHPSQQDVPREQGGNVSNSSVQATLGNQQQREALAAARILLRHPPDSSVHSERYVASVDELHRLVMATHPGHRQGLPRAEPRRR